ncbi:Zn-ribbon domain-containing OB-fold protein [Thermodesulfobacteriota bacterium]
MAKIPIREGLFIEGIDGELQGFKCRSCDHVLPPLTVTCYYCYKEDFEKIALSRQGTLYSYTIVHQPHHNFKTPYPVGYIDLPEGVRIFAPLKQKEGKPFEVGMDMELVIEKLWDEENDEIIGPRFQPV